MIFKRLVFYFQRERESQGILLSKAHSLECQGRDENNRTKDFGCTKPPKYLNIFFTTKNLIQEHSNLDKTSIALFFQFLIVNNLIFVFVVKIQKPQGKFHVSKLSLGQEMERSKIPYTQDKFQGLYLVWKCWYNKTLSLKLK